MIVHRFVPAAKSAKKTVVTFNGTGADVNDLISFVQPIIDENTNILGLQGKYPLNRWVSSMVGVSFDKEEIALDSEELINDLKTLSEKYEFDLNNLVFLGFSNGANFILSFLYTNPGFCKKAVCLHCMKPFELEKKQDLSGLELLITHGSQDQFASDDEVAEVVEYFSDNSASVAEYYYDGNHFFVSTDEVEIVKNFLI
jgi:phospholipase/carboxylesterase